MINPLFKLTATALLVISSSCINLSVTAETKPDSSSSISSEDQKKLEATPEQSSSEVETPIRPTLEDEPNKTTSPHRSNNSLEVNPRSEQWEDINTGDSNRGTVRVRIK